MKLEKFLIGFRWAVVAALGLLCLYFFKLAVKGEDYGTKTAYGIFSVCALILMAVCIRKEAAGILCWPLTAFIDRVFLGAGGMERPPLSYRLAHHYRSEWLLEEAAVEYRRLREWHPRELEVWSEGIAVLRALGRDEEAAKWLRQSLRHIRDRTGRRKLEQVMTMPMDRPVVRALADDD